MLGSLTRLSLIGGAGAIITQPFRAAGALASAAGAHLANYTHLRVLVKAIDYASWLSRQHHLGNMLKGLKPDMSEADLDTSYHFSRIGKVSSWPSLFTGFPWLIDAATDSALIDARQVGPFHPDIEGLHTLFKESRFLESKLGKIPGYSVETLEDEAAKGLLNEIFATLHPAGRTTEHLLDRRNPVRINEALDRALIAYSQNTAERLELALVCADPSNQSIIVRGPEQLAPVLPEPNPHSERVSEAVVQLNQALVAQENLMRALVHYESVQTALPILQSQFIASQEAEANAKTRTETAKKACGEAIQSFGKDSNQAKAALKEYEAAMKAYVEANSLGKRAGERCDLHPKSLALAHDAIASSRDISVRAAARASSSIIEVRSQILVLDLGPEVLVHADNLENPEISHINEQIMQLEQSMQSLQVGMELLVARIETASAETKEGLAAEKRALRQKMADISGQLHPLKHQYQEYLQAQSEVRRGGAASASSGQAQQSEQVEY
jgi:hypothetical protein